MDERGVRYGDALAWLHAGGVQGGVAVLDANGRGIGVLVHARCDRYESASQELVGDVELLVAGLNALFVW